ncbi:hypothetical protein MLD38_021287 [Melastoma candidum]|uniref:Uncharacterized protein n=1 Tax=Melastoma candidum TaxID=119954 RepID=A0ACB9QFM7_9MYRT|nr:hypothetical protein MLD38_021287 [Melastoma candidum]
MTGNPSKFSSLKLQNGGSVTFGDDSKDYIKGIGTIGSSQTLQIDDVLLVAGLKHSLVSVSQLCDKGYQISFNAEGCSGTQTTKSVS